MSETGNERGSRPLRAGTVTRLVAQKHDPHRVSVFIDGTYAFGVHRDVLIEFGFRKGQVLTVEQQQRAVDADRGRAARAKALDYLGYKARTEHEVRQKLIRTGFEEPVVEHALARLRELGYLDDEAYARSYAESRFRAKGYGPARIRSDLLRRGVSRDIVEDVTTALTEEEDMLEAARAHAEKRWPRVVGESDVRKRRKKLSDYLLRRGFSYDTVRRVVDEFERRAEQ